MSEESESLGSVAEEAMKLFSALQDWAKESASSDGAAAVAGASTMFSSINEHLATGGQGCRYCPLCQLISAAREVSPEVKQHLSSAGTSLLQALSSAMVAGAGAESRRRGDEPIVKIDLSDDAWDE